MGKRSAVVELFLGDMGSIQRETRPSIQREDQLTMETKLEQIAASAVKQLPKSVGAGNPHATFCGNRGRATASGDPVLGVKLPGLGLCQEGARAPCCTRDEGGPFGAVL